MHDGPNRAEIDCPVAHHAAKYFRCSGSSANLILSEAPAAQTDWAHAQPGGPTRSRVGPRAGGPTRSRGLSRPWHQPVTGDGAPADEDQPQHHESAQS